METAVLDNLFLNLLLDKTKEVGSKWVDFK